jgi:redox-sensitive bicupin YhaK (pirin superfamily)
MMSEADAISGLRFSGIVAPEPHPVGQACMIRQFRHTQFDGAMSPLVLADHFVMTGPTFEVHPHAGMSAVTLLLEDTVGEMSSHDSVHNDHHIAAGDLHWTLAGKGIVHTQQPVGSNARLNGLQLFVNLPTSLKRLDPATMLVRSADMPVLQQEGVRLKLVAGELEGRSSPLQAPQAIQIIDASLQAGASTELSLPEGWHAWLYVLEGGLTVAEKQSGQQTEQQRRLTQGSAIAMAAEAGAGLMLTADNLNSGQGCHAVWIAAPALHEPVVQQGPFVMSSQEDLARAIADYQAGKFGSVQL